MTFLAAPGGDGDTDGRAAFQLWGEVLQELGQDVVAVFTHFVELGRRGWRAERLAEVGFGDDGADWLLPLGIDGIADVQIKVEAKVVGVRQPGQVLAAVADHLVGQITAVDAVAQ